MKSNTVKFASKPSEIPFATDGLKAPTFYVEDIRGAMSSDGVVKLNLVDYRVNVVTDELVAIHVATLVLPANKLGGWSRYLHRLTTIDAEQSKSPEEPDAEA